MNYNVMLTALLIAVVLFPIFTGFMRRFQVGQNVRNDGPRSHLRKQGTVTMGGFLFLLIAIITAIIFNGRGAIFWLVLLMAVFNGAVGMADDYIKVVRHRSLGLRARDKLLLQIFFSVVFYYVFRELGYNAELTIPFSSVNINIGWLYPFLVLFFLVGFANAVNLTDGLDGLAGGLSVIALMCFALIADFQGLTSLVIFDLALIGSLLGFLFFNIHPAKIFMGDVGSLALGAVLAANALLTKTEILSVIICGVFVVETLSVIFQVISFQLTGKRILLMAPLHHHFEIKGWTEWHVVTAFWGVGFLLAVAALLEQSFF